ncbi:MAG: tetratricopeptide repeat protein [Deltaproteobacteria bacterium]|jgi:tetratricopeptide (TPR) repeat protein|nr:tetratricopeptide repeat protein [Deltaproteobacteria bacterium]
MSLIFILLFSFINISPAQEDKFFRNFSLGQYLYKQKQYQKAISRFDKALQANTKQDKVLLWRAMTYLALKKYSKAEEDLMALISEGYENEKIYYLFGMVVLKQQKYMWAMRSFKRCLFFNQNNQRARFYLAYTLMKIEEYENSRKLLEKILESSQTDKEIQKKARLLFALCNYRLKKLSQARKQLFSLNQTQKTRSLDKMLNLIYKRELGLKHGWGANIRIDAGMDSNPSMNTDGIIYEQADQKAALVNDISLHLWWNPNNSISAELSFLRSSYFSPWDDVTNQITGSFSKTAMFAGTSWRHIYLEEGDYRLWEIGYNFSLVALDGGDGIPLEDSIFLFSERHSLQAGWKKVVSSDVSHAFVLSPNYTTFRDIDRNGFGITLMEQSNYFFNKKQNKIFNSINLGFQDAKWAAWKNLFAGFWLGTSFIGPYKTDLVFSISGNFKYFLETDDVFAGGADNSWGLEDGKERIDFDFGAGILLSRDLDSKKRFKLQLKLQYSNNWSTAAYFNYDRFITMLGIQGRLSL